MRFRYAYHLNYTQPVRCTIISDQPLIYIPTRREVILESLREARDELVECRDLLLGSP